MFDGMVMEVKGVSSYMRNLALVAIFCVLAFTSCRSFIGESRTAGKAAVPSAEYPLAGFWKDHCSNDYGLAIAPAGNGYYSISFCGPGGCSEPGTYRPNSKIVDDSNYRVIDNDTIEIKAKSVSEYDELARSIDKLGMTKETKGKALSELKKLTVIGWLPNVRCPGR